MRWLRKIPLRLRSLFRRDAVDQELTEEMRFHLERQIAENLAAGMSPTAAGERCYSLMPLFFSFLVSCTAFPVPDFSNQHHTRTAGSTNATCVEGALF